MTNQLPERIWAWEERDKPPVVERFWIKNPDKCDWTETLYLRADTTITRAEAAAMAAAALDRAAQACEKAAYSGKYPRDDMAELWCLRCRDDVKNLTPAAIRAPQEPSE